MFKISHFPFFLAPLALVTTASAAVSLYIDDFADPIGVSEESDTILGTVQALIVNGADPSDVATVAVSLPHAGQRTGTFVVPSGAASAGGSASTISGFLLLSLNDGGLGGETSDFSFDYDFSSVFDATGGGLLDTVELDIDQSDWAASKGTLNVDFVESGSGDTATWSITPTVGPKSSLLSALSNAGAVDFSQISDIKLRFEDGTDLDLALTEFGLSGTGVPEPSTGILAIIGTAFLIGRRQRRR